MTKGCPDPAYFAARDAYVVDRTSFTIERLPDLGRLRGKRREFHRLTVVLLDGSGDRIGESAFAVDFEVRRESS